MRKNDHSAEVDQEQQVRLQRELAELREENSRLREQLVQAQRPEESVQQTQQSLDQVDKIIHQSTDLESLMEDFLDATLKIFGCDRAWLLYPCDPEAPSWQVLMERTVSEYPGALELKTDLPMNAESRDVFQRALDSRQPVCYDPKSSYPLPADSAEQFSFKAQMTLAIYPRTGKPWLFGIHQCSYPRIWKANECKLFEQLGRRLPDGFSTFLTTRQLQESEQKFRSLVANLPGVVYRSKNAHQRVISYISDPIEELSGYPATDFINEHVRTFHSIIHPDDRQAVDANISQAIDRHEPFDIEYCLQTRSGQIRWVQERGLAIYDEEGTFQYLDGLIIDISAKKTAETEIHRLEDALVQSEKLRSLGTLAAGVAHEINNPLAAILQSLQVMQRRLSQDGEKNRQAALAAGTNWQALGTYLEDRQINRLLDSSLAAGQKASQIVQTLYNFSRDGEPAYQTTDLAKILASTIELVTSSLTLKTPVGQRGIVLNHEICADLPAITADPNQLQQVFLNLLKNAIRACAMKLSQLPATELPSYQPTIDILLEQQGAQLQAVVADNGIGISQQERSSLFDPFYTTKQPGEGPGLGLSLSYYLITNNHKGQMRVESEPGTGSRFIIQLPLKTATV